MIKRKITFRATDTEYKMIKEYARSTRRTVSNFMLSAAMSEMNRHIPRKTLEGLIRSIIQEELKNASPCGNRPAGVII